MYRVEGKQCENEVDLAELQAALENSFTEHRYFLDLESGTVVLVTDETSRELEDVYVELPEEAESAPVVEAIRRRPLQDWHIEELLQADQVERGYGTRYIRVEPRDPHADYHDMEDFTPALHQTHDSASLKPRLARRHGRTIGCKCRDSLRRASARAVVARD
ncbi:hypothetical protein ANRL3_02022 [Anaerolineae bacterium]|nr:hypothetical protein ANRL3_02022 [Anaerolineae bacterium]